MAYYALKKDVFDISKITVVGNPTITSDGVLLLDGTSNRQNYVRSTVPELDTTKPFKLYLPFKTMAQGTSDAMIYYLQEALQLNYAYNGDIRCFLRSGTSETYWDIVTNLVIAPASVVSTKKDILLVIEFTGSRYTFGYIVDGIYIEQAHKDTTTTTIYNSNIFSIGWNNVNAPAYSGQIDLKQFKIYVDGQLVFQPVKPAYLLERRKEGYDPSKFTIVGSPTITEYGVASGFTASDYLTLPATTFNPKSTIWEIMGSFVGATSTATQVILTKTKNTYFGLRLLLSTANKMSLEVSNNGTSNVFSTTSNLSITLGKKYYFKLKFTGTQYILDLSEDNISWTNYITQNNTNTVYDDVDNPITIGAKGNQFFQGSIDLKQFSITVDGEEVFTGAKEVYYAMEK